MFVSQVQYVRFMSREDDPSSAIGRGWASTYSATTQGIYLDVYILDEMIRNSMNEERGFGLLICYVMLCYVVLYCITILSQEWNYIKLNESNKITMLSLLSAEVETALRASQSTFEWLPNGVLKTVTKVLPAIRFDGGEKRSNTKNFFNSVVAAFTGKFYYSRFFAIFSQFFFLF